MTNRVRKTSIFILLIVTCFYLQAQSQKSKKVDFKYIQNPLTKIDLQWKYAVEINQLSKEDIAYSQSEYEKKVQEAKEEYDQALKAYEDASAAEKLVMGKPKKRNVQSYFIASLVNEKQFADQYVDIVGFQKAGDEASFFVKVSLKGFQPLGVTPIENEKTSQHGYNLNYNNNAIIELHNKSGEVIWSTSIEQDGEGEDVYTGKSSTEAKSNFEKNKTSHLKELEDKSYKTLMENINTVLNDQIGFPEKEMTLKLYTAKGKKFDYSNIDDALANTTRALLLSSENREEAESHLKKAIEIWSKELENSDMNDKKARINKFIATALNINLAYASAILNDFESASKYYQDVKIAGITRFNLIEEDLKEFIAEFKERNDS